MEKTKFLSNNFLFIISALIVIYKSMPVFAGYFGAYPLFLLFILGFVLEACHIQIPHIHIVCQKMFRQITNSDLNIAYLHVGGKGLQIVENCVILEENAGGQDYG